MPKILLMIVGFVMLPFGARWLIEGALALGRRYGFHAGLATLLIVAFGTSLPELAVNTVASLERQGSIIVGNVYGSGIANTLLILGIVSLLHPLVVRSEETRRIGYEILGAIILTLLSFFLAVGLPWALGTDPMFLRWHGGVLLLGFAAFISLRMRDRQRSETGDAPNVLTIRAVLGIPAGLVALLLGGHFVVDGVLEVAYLFAISDGFVAATLVAVGTSLPELTTAVALSRRNEAGLAMTDIVGSNVFNVGLVLALGILIHPFELEGPDITIMLLSSLAITVLGGIFAHGRMVSRPVGAALIICYVMITLSIERTIV